MPATILLGLAVFVVGVDSYVAAVLPAIADDLREPVANVGLICESPGAGGCGLRRLSSTR
jgi:predicted MFS family arabinose efflux permease